MNKILLIIVFFSSITKGIGQELNCKVTVNSDQIQTTDRNVFKDMERAFAIFMNTRKWTNDNYKSHERINCSIFMNLSKGSVSIGSYSASVQITVARPIFNTNYETVLLNFADMSGSLNTLNRSRSNTTTTHISTTSLR